ncbi:DUF5117 domain-containing protein [Aquimarina sp. TRL1]|nr:DUF5117 domain-containing protein [Aquimarina sp. TRL1]
MKASFFKKYNFFLFLLIGLLSHGQFLEKQKNMSSYKGFFDFYYSQEEDKIFLAVDQLDTEFLYVYSLASGLGSNDVGLDRGKIGNGVVVKFQKAGNKLLLVQPNLKYRAITSNELEKKSVGQAFASSVLHGFPIKETKGNTYIIDITSFLLEDVNGVIGLLKRRKDGVYSIDKSRSAIQLERTKAFPNNVEFEALVTFKGTPKGHQVRSVASDARSFSLVQHHSFVALPDKGYKKRVFDPRSGAISISYLDYATPVQEPIVKRFVTRHRLEKKDPAQSISEAKEPIIYYLDPGVPEPVKSALLDGAKWWGEAFEAIGFKNAFQVKMLPADADPMDVRYNVIQWVHRSTRGWSYGASVVDPRTGEIIKGHVSLGSLRIRQDFLIAQALLNKPFEQRDDNYNEMLEMALSRIRQLSAHEVGHTIGFAHNFAASMHNRASVMDYPHPLITLKDGQIDLSNAYAVGIGDWDKVTVAYSYSQFEAGIEEKKALNAILDKAYQEGHRFISDSDARPPGGAHAGAHLWDNGASASEELKRVLEVRNTAIAHFSKDNIRSGEPYTVLEDVFVPLYFFHRYQTEAAVKLIGGLSYNYAVKGDEQHITSVVSNVEQRVALNTLIKTILPETLAIPQDKLKLFPPRAYGYWRTRESFKGKTGVSFDPISVAETASDMSLSLLLHPQRASRLVLQKGMDSSQLGLSEVMDELIAEVFKKKQKDGYYQEIQEVVKRNLLKYLKNLSVHKEVYPQVNAIAQAKLISIMDMLKKSTAQGAQRMYDQYYEKQIRDFMKKPEGFKVISAPKIPDGSPIGSDSCMY